MSLKAQRAPADTSSVRAGHPLPAAVDRVIADLPPDFVVAQDGEARFVAGPAGAFVLMPTPARGPAVDDAAARVHRLARRTRSELGDHVAWVPFLDALLVSTSGLVRRPDVTVAPIDLLAVVLTEGPRVIDRPTLAAVRRILAQRRLGPWRAALPDIEPAPATVSLSETAAAGGRIDLCDTSDPSPATSPT
jgi:hypothetical protein